MKLSAEANSTYYKLSVRFGEMVRDFTFEVDRLTVAPPVGGAFTGAMFGIYSCGQWEPVLDPADFTSIYIADQGTELDIS